MKLGLFCALLSKKGYDLERALDYLSELGITAVELAPFPGSGTPHLNVADLMADVSKVQALHRLLERYGMEISALSCHGNPVHPRADIADSHRSEFEATVKLAERLGVERVVTFSGCPGDSPGSRYPNWVTYSWPTEFLELLDFQWNEVLIPYWRATAEFCTRHGVDKICIEPHPNFCVYNTETMLRLRDAVGPSIGVNFDPSHFFWQGIDPAAAVRELGSAIYHCHVKDVWINQRNVQINGVLDATSHSEETRRSWLFRTVGYGHDAGVWKDIVSCLRLVGYDHVLSIEHEDTLMSVPEGIRKAVSFLRSIVLTEMPDDAMWARLYPRVNPT